MIHINKIRNERREIITDTKEFKRIVRKQYEQLYVNKLDKLDEINKFLETYNLPKVNQEELENLNRQITPSESEAVIKKISQQIKTLYQMASQVNFTKHSRKKQHLSSNYFNKCKRREGPQTHFMRPAYPNSKTR